MKPKITAVKHDAQSRPGPFYIQRNFALGRPSADMVRRLLRAHRAA